MNTKNITSLEVTKDFRRRLKIAAAEKGVSMKVYLEQLVPDHERDNSKPN